MNYLVSGEVPQRRGNGGFGGVPSQAFDCADGMIFIVAGNDKQFAALCRALDRPQWAADARFDHPGGRVVHRDALLELLRARLREQTVAHWLALLDAADVPASPVNELPQVFANPQVQHRGLLVNTEHSQAGPLPLLASPLRLSATPVTDYPAPPTVGQHTKDVLREKLGFTDTDLAALVERGVI
jgi:crotonobetainyl-CoA:carnitine CoA-transferase CaiB-like acyl-CoA transferase